MKQIKIYSENIEQGALDQFDSAMEQDYSIKGALMADAHYGYSLPVGGVVATQDVIVPAWVGYDIGCGMCALPVPCESNDVVRGEAQKIFEDIYDRVPVGRNVHPESQKTILKREDLSEFGKDAFDKRKGFMSMGTLGGGNHFIEIGAGDDNQLWIIIHSGSRGVGHGIATNYMRAASGDGKVREGHYPLLAMSDLGQSYINDMNWALAFALENRKSMIRTVVDTIGMYTDIDPDWDNLINRNHNHAEFNSIEGLYIHRKGATHAEKDMMGVIPGNMRDGSFIVKGLGNPDSLYSSSHGAGRVLGRRVAKETLDMDEFKSTMAGVTAKVGASTLDESPMAYKNIFEVMNLQKDLVEVINYVKPIINVKG